MTDNSASCASHCTGMRKPDVARGQFLRVEKFAMQAPHGKQGGNTILKVAQEAVRMEGFCPHVEHPLAPTVLYGVGPMEAAEQARSWHQAQTAQVLHKPSQALIARKFRADKPCAMVGVISVPPEWTPDGRWAQFCEAALDWLKTKYPAGRLTSVLEHRDERCLHLHFWVVPLSGEGFSAIHPGEQALDQVGRNSARILRDAAYKKAMAGLLDEFHRGVGRDFGLERETVGARRRSRADWLRRQYLDEQRELDVQRRIDTAVASALHQLKVDQERARALEELITDDIKLKLEVSRGSGTDCPALSSFIGIDQTQAVQRPEVTGKETLTGNVVDALGHPQIEVAMQASPTAISNTHPGAQESFTPSSPAIRIRARDR